MMCAILDSSVCGRVFGGEDRLDSGKGFFDWINDGNGRLIIGGKLRDELYRNFSFKDWADGAMRYDLLVSYDDDDVNESARQLTGLVSNDAHVIALAIMSDARLLCTDDENLKKDFKSKNLIPKRKRSIYSISIESRFDKGKRDLLQRSKCKM